MTLTNFVPWPDTFLTLLADVALRTSILAGAAGIALSLFRVRSTSVRLFTWTSVLYAAVALPFLCGLLPAVPVPVPSLLRSAMMAPAAAEGATPQSGHSKSGQAYPIRVRRNPQEETTLALRTIESSSPELRSDTRANRTEVLHRLSENWLALAGVAYFSIAMLMMTRLCLGIFLAARLRAQSCAIREPRVIRSLAFQIRSRIRPPQILESGLVTVPITLGTICPAIVLPANWSAWDQSKLDAVLAHELSHVTRHDAFTQLLARLYRAAFWFNPLSWWLDRQIHLLAEQASDEAALSAGVDRGDYAKALLGFFEALQSSPRVWWQGVSMANAGQAEHRLERILSWRGVVNMSSKKSVLVAIAALAVPAVYVVAAARPATPQPAFQQASESPQLPPAVEPGVPPGIPAAPAMAPAAPSAPVHGVIAAGPAAPALPGTPAVPGIPAAPAIWSGQSYGTGSSHNRTFYAYNFDDEQPFVIVSGNSDSLTMSGTSEDAHHVQRLKKQIPGDFIWFRRDEKSYIIRDAATVDRARKLWAPQEEIGKKQEELGKQQEALGKEQEELGAKMEQVRVNIPDMTAQLDALKAKLQKLGPTATIEQLGDLQSEIGELQSKIGEMQSHAGDAQGKFGEEQGALGEKQGKLGELQGELGRQQAEIAKKATKQMKALLDEAIKNGTAKPEPDSNDGGTI